MIIERNRLKFTVLEEINQVQQAHDQQLAAQKEAGSYPAHIPDGLTLFFPPVVLLPKDGDKLPVRWTMQVHKSDIPDSYWPNCQFTFDALFSEVYPASPPKVTCKTPIFHPNISPSGLVCLPIIRDWRPNATLFH